MTFEKIPDGLHAVQLARKICEDTCGFPATQGNLTLIADCIVAVGKKLFQSRPDADKMGCFVLQRRVETAQSQGIKINTHWFRNGEYWDVERPKEELNLWGKWKAEQKKAEQEGKLATEEDYAFMRSKLKEFFAAKRM